MFQTERGRYIRGENWTSNKMSYDTVFVRKILSKNGGYKKDMYIVSSSRKL